MAIKDALLQEFDHEMATSRKVIERVPEDKFDYKPHDRSMTMGALASHIADMPTWAVVGIAQDSLDLAGGFKPFRPLQGRNWLRHLTRMSAWHAARLLEPVTKRS